MVPGGGLPIHISNTYWQIYVKNKKAHIIIFTVKPYLANNSLFNKTTLTLSSDSLINSNIRNRSISIASVADFLHIILMLLTAFLI